MGNPGLKPRDHNGITLKALTEACKGLQVGLARVGSNLGELSIKEI